MLPVKKSMIERGQVRGQLPRLLDEGETDEVLPNREVEEERSPSKVKKQNNEVKARYLETFKLPKI